MHRIQRVSCIKNANCSLPWPGKPFWDSFFALDPFLLLDPCLICFWDSGEGKKERKRGGSKSADCTLKREGSKETNRPDRDRQNTTKTTVSPCTERNDPNAPFPPSLWPPGCPPGFSPKTLTLGCFPRWLRRPLSRSLGFSSFFLGRQLITLHGKALTRDFTRSLPSSLVSSSPCVLPYHGRGQPRLKPAPLGVASKKGQVGRRVGRTATEGLGHKAPNY